jgi:hypothetical protein
MRARIVITFSLIWCAWLLIPSQPSLDDAYIYLHSARSIVEGWDYRYNVPPLTGVTSPAYVSALTLLMSIGVPSLIASRIMAFGSLLTFMGAVLSLGAALDLPDLQRLLFLALSLVLGGTVYHVTSGMETGLAMALVIVLISWILQRRADWIALGCGLLPWVRPDLALMSVSLWLWSAWRLRPALRRYIALTLLTAVPWPVWLFLNTGSLIPDTINAKRLFFAQSCWPLARKFAFAAGALEWWTVWTAPIVVGLVALFRIELGRLALAAIAATFAVYFVTFPGAFNFNWCRYLFPILLPWCLYGTVLLVKWLPGTRWRQAAIAFIAVICVFSPGRRPPSGGGFGSISEGEETARWIETHIEPSAVILIQDAGVISESGRQPLVDLVGLKTPSSIETHARMTFPSCGNERGRAIATIANVNHADYIVVTTEWDQFFGFTSALRQAGFSITTMRLPSPGAWGYAIYRLGRPAAL